MIYDVLIIFSFTRKIMGLTSNSILRLHVHIVGELYSKLYTVRVCILQCILQENYSILYSVYCTSVYTIVYIVGELQYTVYCTNMYTIVYILYCISIYSVKKGIGNKTFYNSLMMSFSLLSFFHDHCIPQFFRWRDNTFTNIQLCYFIF